MNRSVRCIAAVALACAGASSLPAASISLPASLWDGVSQLVVVVNTGLTTPEGPACDSAGDLYFSDHRSFSHTDGVIWKVPSGGAAGIYKQSLDVPCGMVFDSRNRLLYGGWHGLWRVDNLAAPAGVTALASGDSLLEANDLSLCSDGGILFTANLWSDVGHVYYRSAAGGSLKHVVDFPASPAAFPNGIEYVEEKQRMYVCLSQLNLVRTYRLDAQMNASSPAQFASVSGPDGIAVDQQGNVWVASSNGNRIAVYDSAGASLGAVILDWGTTNCAFGGAGLTTLYITGGTAVLSLQLKVAGRPTTGSVRVAPAAPRHGVAPSQPSGRRLPGVYCVSGERLSRRAAAGVSVTRSGSATRLSCVVR